MAEIQYRAACEADLPGLVALHQEVYGRPRTEAHYRWKFFAPIVGFGVPRLWVAELDGRLVGCGGALPYPFWVDGKPFLAASFMEYHVIKELRRQGVQLKINEHLHAALVNNDVVYTFGMPNESSTVFCAAIQMLPLFRTVWLQRSVSWFSALRHRAPQNCRVRTLEAPGNECAQLWERLRDNVNCCSVPTADWLQYRYIDCPIKDYALLLAEDDQGPCGLMVLGQKPFGKRSEAVIAYALVRPDDEETWQALIVAAARWARGCGLAGLRTLVSDAPGQHRAWQALGFREAQGDFVIHARDARGQAFPASMHSPEIFTPRLGDHDFI